MNKASKIVMPFLGDCKKIAEAFGCTKQTVSNALNYHTPYSELGDKIRKYALENGGVVVKYKKNNH